MKIKSLHTPCFRLFSCLKKNLTSLKISSCPSSHCRVDIPKAPGLGLMLDKLHYDTYNRKFGNDGLHQPLDWDDYKEEMEKFKLEQVFKGDLMCISCTSFRQILLLDCLFSSLLRLCFT